MREGAILPLVEAAHSELEANPDRFREPTFYNALARKVAPMKSPNESVRSRPHRDAYPWLLRC